MTVSCAGLDHVAAGEGSTPQHQPLRIEVTVAPGIGDGCRPVLQLTLDIQQQKQDVALLQEELKKQESVADSNDSALAEAREKLTLARNQYEESQREFGQLKAEQSGAAQRADVIEELEKKLEGLQAGVKQVLSMANENIDTPFGEVAGMVADLVQVNVEHAPLIDVILGEVAQYVVVSGNLLNDALRTREVHLLGRIGFLQLDDLLNDIP